MTFYIQKHTLPLSDVELLLLRKAISLTLTEKSIEDVFRKLTYSKSKIERDASLFNLDLRVIYNAGSITITDAKGNDFVTIKSDKHGISTADKASGGNDYSPAPGEQGASQGSYSVNPEKQKEA